MPKILGTKGQTLIARPYIKVVVTGDTDADGRKIEGHIRIRVVSARVTVSVSGQAVWLT